MSALLGVLVRVRMPCSCRAHKMKSNRPRYFYRCGEVSSAITRTYGPSLASIEQMTSRYYPFQIAAEKSSIMTEFNYHTSAYLFLQTPLGDRLQHTFRDRVSHPLVILSGLSYRVPYDLLPESKHLLELAGT